MYKAIKYELKPNKTERIHLDKTFGCCRYIYNRGLEKKTKAYTEDNVNISCFDLMKQLTSLKKKEEYSRLSEVGAQQLQASLSNLDAAYKNFFRAKKGFPKFKKKGCRESFKITQNVKINYDNYTLFMPKLGRVKFFRDKHIQGTIKNATVSKTPTGRYFVSVCYETAEQRQHGTGIVGIDFGLKDFAICSDGTIFENQRYLRSNLAKLRIEQRSLERKRDRSKSVREQSNNYYKQRLRVAKLHEKITNQRKDFLHKFSNAISQQYETVCIEDLHVRGMLQNRNLSLSISDVGRGLARQSLEYKVKDLRVIGRFEPSSKMCSSCGKIKQELSLSTRTYNCEQCGFSEDRDINAATNIMNLGQRASALNANVDH